jgi:hypothetical protein
MAGIGVYGLSLKDDDRPNPGVFEKNRTACAVAVRLPSAMSSGRMELTPTPSPFKGEGKIVYVNICF